MNRDNAMVIGPALELALLGLQIWLQASQMAGMNQAERDRVYALELAKFQANLPENLPDV